MEISEKKLAANRLNAQKSTGPKSPGGKHNSSQNAITHGLFARSILLPGESADRLHALHAAYINQFNPETPAEFDLIETMLVNRWRLRRVWTLETASLTHEQNSQAASTRGEDPPLKTVLAHRSLTNPPATLESLSRYEGRCDRQYNRAVDRLRDIQAAKNAQKQKNAKTNPPATTESIT